MIENVLLYRSSYSHVSSDIWIYIILAVGVIAVCGWYFSKSNRLKRQLRSMKSWPLAELPEDTQGRVVGHAQALQHVLTSPLTGRPCVYYIAKVEEHRSSGRSSYWKTIISESNFVPFQLIDQTGRAIVDPAGAEVVLDFDGSSSSGTFNEANPTQEAFLQRHGHKSKGWIFNKGLRYREAVIHIGETVAVMGAGVREPDPDASPTAEYRGAPATRLRLMHSAKCPLVISDDPSTTVTT